MINGIKMIKKTHKIHSDTIKSARSIYKALNAELITLLFMK